MTQIKSTVFYDCSKLKSVFENTGVEFEKSGIAPDLTSFINYFLPLGAKFLSESYVAYEKDKVQGLITLEKDEKNRINRVANCMQKNYDKSVLASVRQIRAIEAIARAQGLDKLDEPLRQTAQARLEDKEASFKELAQRLNISKSCLNHRLRKLTQIADELNGGQHGTR